MPTSNAYSENWFKTFGQTVEEARTEREVLFILRQLPVEHFKRMLDVCCGAGRHARHLANLGYLVTGFDRSPWALEEASRVTGGQAEFIQGDMAQLDAVVGPYDAVICMWQSFGYFDDAGNEAVLRSLAQRLTPDGRVLLDVYDRLFFERAPRRRVIRRGGDEVLESSEIVGHRLRVTLRYRRQRVEESFEWRAYTLRELTELGSKCGFDLLLARSNFDETEQPLGRLARMQLVFRKQGAQL